MDRPALTPPTPLATDAPARLDACPAPAKLNLFLHVVGRRADGYHLLQTAFRLLDWGDTLDFALRTDGRIRRVNEVPGVAEADDLVVRAARLLQAHTGCTLGADITVHKVLPMGGGIGGGSSDAATTLIALNRLWGLRPVARRTAGARPARSAPTCRSSSSASDAFAEGVGEALQPLALPPAWYVVISPGVSVPTAEIFSAKDLTREYRPHQNARTSQQAPRETTCKPSPAAVTRKCKARSSGWTLHAPARMTGSGACVFAEVSSEARGRPHHERLSATLESLESAQPRSPSALRVVTIAPASSTRCACSEKVSWGVAKSVKAPDFDSGIRGFESFLPSHTTTGRPRVCPSRLTRRISARVSYGTRSSRNAPRQPDGLHRQRQPQAWRRRDATSGYLPRFGHGRPLLGR